MSSEWPLAHVWATYMVKRQRMILTNWPIRGIFRDTNIITLASNAGWLKRRYKRSLLCFLFGAIAFFTLARSDIALSFPDFFSSFCCFHTLASEVFIEEQLVNYRHWNPEVSISRPKWLLCEARWLLESKKYNKYQIALRLELWSGVSLAENGHQ